MYRFCDLTALWQVIFSASVTVTNTFKKQFPYFYRQGVEVWKNEKCCGNRSCRGVYLQLFQVLLNFHESLCNSIEARRTSFVLKLLIILLRSYWTGKL